ncbi:MAG: hypothetical protein HFI56_15215 [Lachnospiraceae bacterium]|nr:hypothetical protein [Lachnospiraceae bacterium]
MVQKRKVRYKKLLAFLLSFCMAVGVFVTDVMPVQASVAFYASDKDLKPYQSEISNWSSGCHVCSVAMVLTAMGKSNSTPYEVWKNNKCSVGITWDNIHKNYNVQTNIGYFSGTSDDKYRQLYSLCQQYPYGVDVYAPYTNSSGVQQSHFIYAFIENGTLYIHNPGYTSWSYRIVGKNATHYDDYRNFTSYRIFVDKGGGTITPTPPSTQDPITFQTPTYANVTETTAYVQVNVTADSSQLSKVGMKWDKIVGSTYYHQPEFSWPGSSVRSHISVDFGKEIDKNGNKPSLSPGNTYQCQFFAITKAGKTLYSTVVQFTTRPTASSDITPPVISNIKVTPTDGGYYVECDVYDNVGITKVEFPTWSIQNGQDDLQMPWPVGERWSQRADGTETYVIKINASDHNNEQGYYTTHIYAYDAAGNRSFAAVTPDTCVDWTKPTISDIKITDQTSTGYTVQCRATDNTGVSHVRFPIWTDKNGQDDIIWREGTKNGDIYTLRVNISDHNNEYGVYHTHIYAYDAAGNEQFVAAPDCNINPLIITEQPESCVRAIGETAVFRIAVTGNNLRYQWQYKTAGSNSWNHCNTAGSTTPELRFPIIGKQNDQTEFRCIVSDNSNTVISQSAILSVMNNVKKYTVTFDSQGGTLVDAITNIVENTKIVSMPNPPVRDNFTFVGWYTEPNGQGRIFNENTIINGDMTVYAYWHLQTTVVPNGFWINDIPMQRYTGKAIKPFIEVYDGTKLLKERVDYTLSYKNNIRANDVFNARTAPTVVVKGKGNYSGTETAFFAILSKNINGEDVIIDNITRAFNNNLQKPIPVVSWNGKKLKNETDFTVRYPDADENAYKAEGTYQIEISGKGNYTGKRVIQFTITNKKLMSKVSVAKIPNQPYTGSEIIPKLLVKDGRIPLEENTDYSVSYKNNLETGTATAVLTGLGAYCGEKRISFKITGIDIRKATVADIPDSVMYMGESITLNPYLTINSGEEEITLEKDRDYTVSYQKNKAVGMATVVFKGINNYSGTLKKTFRITPYDITEDRKDWIEIDGLITAVYMAGGSKPKTTVYFGEQILEEGRDYTLKYSNNRVISSLASPDKLPVVTVQGKGNFKGKRSIIFHIAPQDMEYLIIETQDKVYQNAAGKYKSIPQITDWNGKKLKAGRDYESEIMYDYAEDTVLEGGIIREAGSPIEPTDTLPVGTRVRVTVTGKGNYTGTISDVYRITQQDIRRAKVIIPKQTYTGSVVCPGKEQIEIKIGNTVLADTEYEIMGYRNNVKKGTATVVIHGTGNYGGIKKATFKIASKGVRWWWR